MLCNQMSDFFFLDKIFSHFQIGFRKITILKFV